MSLKRRTIQSSWNC